MAYLFAITIWIAGWALNSRLANGTASDTRIISLLIPIVFGVTLIAMWQVLVTLLEISPIILPAPSDIAEQFAASVPLLWADFQQTILKGALTGYFVGMIAAFGVALLADRSVFLTMGILPVGAFMAALPIVGTAPIFVKWLGSDWQSKAAQARMMSEIALLTQGGSGALDIAAYERTVATLLAGGSDPVISTEPTGAYTTAITDAALQ